MLSFLRKTRKSLVDSRSSQKYLLYAIGEIILVVLGILIALQINNWNEKRKERLTERQFLISLQKEFQNNRTTLGEHILWKQNAQNQWDTFLLTISNYELPPERRSIRRPIASFINFTINNSTLNSILSSGKIDHINNDSLKSMLTNWQDVVTKYQQFEVLHSDFVVNQLMPFERSLFLNDSYRRFYNYDYPFKSQVQQKELYLKAYEKMEYQNILLQNFYWINIHLERIQEVKEKMNTIIQLIEQEIN